MAEPTNQRRAKTRDSLRHHVTRLLEWFEGRGSLPEHDRICILDTTSPGVRFDARDGGTWVTPSELPAVDEHEARFAELMSEDPPWLNLSLYGAHEGALVVGIEAPAYRREAWVGQTTVNLSGPPTARDGSVDWEMRLVRAQNT